MCVQKKKLLEKIIPYVGVEALPARCFRADSHPAVYGGWFLFWRRWLGVLSVVVTRNFVARELNERRPICFPLFPVPKTAERVPSSASRKSSR